MRIFFRLFLLQSPFFFQDVLGLFTGVLDPVGSQLTLAESSMSSSQLIATQGYPVEEHKVVTEDGYILTIFRIPKGRTNTNTSQLAGSKGPVLLQHGILCSSDDWLVLPPNKGLPFLLADQGYDVWLGNLRGNNYSSAHLRLSPDTLEFWDFALDEMGIADTPSTINYILNVTRSSQLSYICHSLGCAALFAGIDRDPGLNNKITKLVTIAPAAYVAHYRSPVYKLLGIPSPDMLHRILNFFNRGRVLPAAINALVKAYGPAVCSSGEIPVEMCKLLVSIFAGYNPSEMSDKTATLVSGHSPADTSSKLLTQYSQMRLVDRFQKYDYGQEENLLRYRRDQPPPYKLALVQVPTLAMYGENDWIISPQDALRTFRELGNVEEIVKMPDPQWNHFDFLYGKTAYIYAYPKIVNFLARP